MSDEDLRRRAREANVYPDPAAAQRLELDFARVGMTAVEGGRRVDPCWCLRRDRSEHCGCGRNHRLLEGDRVVHWLEKHWEEKCAYTTAVDEIWRERARRQLAERERDEKAASALARRSLELMSESLNRAILRLRDLEDCSKMRQRLEHRYVAEHLRGELMDAKRVIDGFYIPEGAAVFSTVPPPRPET